MEASYDSQEDALCALREHEIKINTKFCVVKATKDFGNRGNHFVSYPTTIFRVRAYRLTTVCVISARCQSDKCILHNKILEVHINCAKGTQ